MRIWAKIGIFCIWIQKEHDSKATEWYKKSSKTQKNKQWTRPLIPMERRVVLELKFKRSSQHHFRGVFHLQNESLRTKLDIHDMKSAWLPVCVCVCARWPTRVRHICGPHDASDLLHGLQVWRETCGRNKRIPLCKSLQKSPSFACAGINLYISKTIYLTSDQYIKTTENYRFMNFIFHTPHRLLCEQREESTAQQWALRMRNIRRYKLQMLQISEHKRCTFPS